MKLEILGVDSRFKYISRGWDGTVYLFISKPFIPEGEKEWYSSNYSEALHGITLNIPGDNWTDSVCKIIHLKDHINIVKA